MNRNRVNSLLSDVDPLIIAALAMVIGIGVGLSVAQPIRHAQRHGFQGRLQQLKDEVERLASEVQHAVRR